MDVSRYSAEDAAAAHKRMLDAGWELVDPAAEATTDVETARQAYEVGMRKGALSLRTNARWAFAETGLREAFEILTTSYAKAEHPSEQVQSLLVDIVTEHFPDARWLDGYASWRRKHKHKEDAFLWCRSLIPLARHGSPLAAYEAGIASGNPLLEAAAATAAAYGRDPEARRAVLAQLLARLPTKPSRRGLLLGAGATLALSLAGQLQSPGVKDRVRDLVRASVDPQTPAWARLTVARHVAAMVRLEAVPQDPALLLAALERGPATRAPSRYARPRFMGIEASGLRIAYVIDLSNSMLLPLTDKERAALRQPVVTGKRPARKGAPAGAPEDRIPWSKIKTRFDAARAFLKVSLEDLTKDQSFVIITFGTRAAYLDGKGHMRRASSGSVAKAKRDLDAIKPTSPNSQYPNGTLRGETNLHAGLRLAMDVGTKGREPAYINTAGHERGCDTIFLLSDGAPTEDDWPGMVPSQGGGSKEGERRPTQPASGGMGLAQAPGPYGNAGRYLRGDVWRLNLFRQAEIHCIGLGQANLGLLRSIAQCGLGEARIIGR